MIFLVDTRYPSALAYHTNFRELELHSCLIILKSNIDLLLMFTLELLPGWNSPGIRGRDRRIELCKDMFLLSKSIITFRKIK